MYRNSTFWLVVAIVCTTVFITGPQVVSLAQTPTKSNNKSVGTKTAAPTATRPTLTGQAELPKGAIPGLEVRYYSLGTLVPNDVPTLADNQLPQKIGIIPQMVMADYLKSFDWRKDEGVLLNATGYLKITEARSYNLTVRGSGYLSLKVDGKDMLTLKAVDNVFEKDAEVYLEVGYHKVELQHATKVASYREATLWWFNNDTKTKEYIPASYFYYVPTTDPAISKTKPKIKLGTITLRPGDAAPLEALHPSVDAQILHKQNLEPAVGGLDFMTNGDMIVSTWDSLGQIYRFKNVASGDTNKIVVKRIAMGLAEPLGLKVVADRIFVLQKQELTELVDRDGDEVIDEYKTICNAWGVTGNFHEFAFGLVYQDGFFYATLAIGIMPGGKSANPQNKDRGKVIKIGLNGNYETIASGLRTPNSIGVGPDHELFVADNQGDWLPACKVVHVKKNAFYGNYSVDITRWGRTEVTQPLAWLPQGEIGNSTSQPAVLNWGPYQNQMVVGDVHYGGLQRIAVEKVNGEYQGAAFRFSQGLMGGTNRLAYGPDGGLYIGMVGSTGNWGQYGKKWFGLQRMVYNKASTFEMLTISARTDGFEITFTEPLKAGFGNKVADYQVEQWRYVPTPQYGGPKVDQVTLTPTAVVISADRRKVFLALDGLKEGHVVYFRALPARVLSETGAELWTTESWYTLNAIPKDLPGPVSKASLAAKAQKAKAESVLALANTKPTKAPTAAVLDGGALIESTGCRGCHANDKNGLGPALRSISAKYKGEKKAQDVLTEKVLNGGSGVWGEQAMPTHHHIGKAKVAAMVKFVLAMP